MSLRNTPHTYGSVAKLLHWVMALMILGLIGLGLYMTSEPDGDPKWALYDLHKTIGSGVFVLLVVRVVWRKISPPPGMPVTMGRLEQLAAHAGHAMLYFIMLALPVTGYLDSSYGGYHLSFFGLFDVPMIFDKDEALLEFYAAAHSYIAYGLIAILATHIGAALKHHFITKDDVLRRMTVGR